MNWKRSLVTCVALVASLYMAGCGGSSSTPPSVSVQASATTVDATDTVTLSATVTGDKNAAGVSWSVTGGGTLSGQTTSAATYTAPAASSSALSVTVTATSVADTSKSATATITVPAAPAITTAALATATVGATYAQPLTATGGIAPYAWTLVSGTLPSCLTITQSASGASLGGTLTASCAGTFNDLVFKVTDSGTPNALTATTAAMGLTIDAAPAITFSGVVPATATAHVAYAGGSAAASGGVGTLTYSVFSGTLPNGLSLNASSGAITGTPTTANTFNFVIKAADTFGDSNTQAYTDRRERSSGHHIQRRSTGYGHRARCLCRRQCSRQRRRGSIGVHRIQRSLAGWAEPERQHGSDHRNADNCKHIQFCY